MLKNKKAVSMLDSWAEISTFILLVIGLVVAMLSDSAVVTYIIITLCGFVVGRFYFKKRIKIRFPFYMIVFGFLVGYVIGIQFITKRGTAIFVLLFFAVGSYIGYYLHKQGYMRA